MCFSRPEGSVICLAQPAGLGFEVKDSPRGPTVRPFVERMADDPADDPQMAGPLALFVIAFDFPALQAGLGNWLTLRAENPIGEPNRQIRQAL